MLPAPYTLVVLAGVLMVKGLLFRHVGGIGDSIGSLAIKSDAAHHRSDAITSAFAFVGISIAYWEGSDGSRPMTGPKEERYFPGNAGPFLCITDCMAEREGFEPSVQVLARTTV
jgi:hypothetical protein